MSIVNVYPPFNPRFISVYLWLKKIKAGKELKSPLPVLVF